MNLLRSIAIIAIFGCLFLVSEQARAYQRNFTYTYESLTLNKGEMEIEPWSTVRFGKEDFYLRFDERLEFELGITDRLQTAWYLKFKAINQDVYVDDEKQRQRSFDFAGISWEWKWQLLDAVADPIGLALYIEPGIAPHEAELEAKVILDKRIGDFLVALNLVGEYEWKFKDPEEVEQEAIVEVDLGLGYFVYKSLSVGLEFRSRTEIEVGEGLEHSTLFAGPSIAYSEDRWWFAVTGLAQIAGLHEPTHGILDLDGAERAEVRLLFGILL